MADQKVDGVTISMAAKTIIELFVSVDIKRGGFLVVKWTQASVVVASLFQADMILNDVNNICLSKHRFDEL